jgi:hypothetical protein
VTLLLSARGSLDPGVLHVHDGTTTHLGCLGVPRGTRAAIVGGPSAVGGLIALDRVERRRIAQERVR